MEKKRVCIEEAALYVGVEQKFIIECIHNEWIVPSESETLLLDEEDLARAKLIDTLFKDFGINHEAVTIILHLLDQLHSLRSQIKQSKS